MLHNRILRGVLLAALAVCTLVALPSTAAAQRVFVGGGHIGGGYGWGCYGWGGGPYWGGYGWGYPMYPGAYGYPERSLGEVQIKSPAGDAQIYINGSLAGRAKDLKHFYLQPGTYTLEQRAGSDVQKLRVYIIAGRTAKITFDKPGVPHNPPPAQPAPAPAPASAPAPAQPAPLPPPPAPSAPAPAATPGA